MLYTHKAIATTWGKELLSWKKHGRAQRLSVLVSKEEKALYTQEERI